MEATATNKHKIHGVFGDEVPMLEACKKLRASGIRIKDVYSPMPIHGIDGIIGIPRTRIAICAFIYGITGTSLATLMMWYMMVHDWPNDIGGKPTWAYYFAVPAFIPITFEATVFCAAHGMALTYFLRCWLVPGAKAKNPDPRTTDDKFLIDLELNDAQLVKAQDILKNSGAEEVNHRGSFVVPPAYVLEETH
ncbi:MAG: ABC-type Fe3+ transport system protein [Bacteroidetes bacterium]|nr:ABC-type Fe3+ transport system protein [Bacteroidota bacterium]